MKWEYYYPSFEHILTQYCLHVNLSHALIIGLFSLYNFDKTVDSINEILHDEISAKLLKDNGYIVIPYNEEYKDKLDHISGINVYEFDGDHIL